MINTQLLGETAARCMEYMDGHEALDDGEILAVGIVVVAQNEEHEQTFTRTFCSETVYYRQLGLMIAGVECVRDGFRSSADEEDDDGSSD